MVAKVTRAPACMRRLASSRVGLIWPWPGQDMRRKWRLFMAVSVSSLVSVRLLSIQSAVALLVDKRGTHFFFLWT